MKQELIVKSNVLLQHPLYKKTTELKMFSRVILAIRVNPESNAFTFQIKELLEKFQGGVDNYTELKQIAKGMFRVVDLNPSEKLFHLSAVFTDIFIHEEGVITFEVNPKVKPFLLDLTTNFTQYYFENIARLKSSFSIRIYELLKQYEKIGNRRISLINLKEFLSISSGQYEKYSNFKNKVLLVAYKELKEKSDIYFEFEEIKQGRKITEIKFIIFINNKGSSKNEDETVNKVDLQKKLPSSLNEEQEATKNKLVSKYGLSEKTATELVLLVKIDQIEKNILYAEKEHKDGNVSKNFSGFLLNAIKNNYANNVSLFEVDNKKKEDELIKERKLEERREELRSKFSLEFGRTEKEKFLNSLSELEKEELKNQILEELQLDSMSVSLLKKKGLTSPIAGMWIIKMIPEFEPRRDEYIKQKLTEAGF